MRIRGLSKRAVRLWSWLGGNLVAAFVNQGAEVLGMEILIMVTRHRNKLDAEALLGSVSSP